VSSIVAKSEGKLDLDVFEDPDAGTLDTREAIHIETVRES